VDLANMDMGFMNERVKDVDRMLDLSIERQFTSQQSKIRTAALLPHATSVSAIVTDRRFAEKAKTKFGEDWYKDFTDGIKFAFNGDRKGKLEKAAGYVRTGFTYSVYWGNLLTAVRQLPGVVSAMAHPDIGVKATLSSIASLLNQRGEMSRRVAQSSYITLMRTHAQDADYMSPDEVTSHAKVYQKWLAAGTWPMRTAQWSVDVVTWDAAYNNAMAKYASLPAEERQYKAMAVADRALHETQGSAMRGEAANISQSEMGRLMTFGGKWMLNYGNFLRRQYRAALAEMGTGDTWEARQAFAKSVLIGLVGNAALFAAVGAALRPEKDDEEQRDWDDYAYAVGMDIVSTPNHIVRAFAAPMAAAYLNLPQSRISGDALAPARAFNDAKELVRQVGYIMDDDSKNDKFASPEKIIGNLVSSGGIIIQGVPTVAVKRMLGSDPEQGWEAFVASIFGWDKTPIRKD
jgi:hypothetical protein